MFVQLNCIIVDADAGNRQELAGFLAQFGVHLVAQMPGVEGLPPLLGRQDSPQLVIVNLDPTAHDTLKKLSPLIRQFPQTSFFTMSAQMDATLVMEAMHVGIKEFIPLPIPEDKFSAAIERVASANGMGKRARVINVVPTVGGCGSTTIACNVAAALAKNAKTVLVDLDLMRGGAANYFDIRPKYTIADVMDTAERVDKQLLDNALATHPGCGVSVLARPDLPEDTLRVNQPGLNRLMSVLTRVFDYVVVDSMMSISPLYNTVLNMADVNVIVMQLNVPSAKNAERYLGALRRAGIESAKVRLVVNRFVKKGWDIEPEEVERALALKIAWMVPNDFKNAISSINFGEPVVLRAPRSEMSVSLLGLAAMLNGNEIPARQAA